MWVCSAKNPKVSTQMAMPKIRRRTKTWQLIGDLEGRKDLAVVRFEKVAPRQGRSLLTFPCAAEQ